jgi:hypothetical protein
MSTIKGLYRKVQTLDVNSSINSAFEKNKERLLELNRLQLLEGKTKLDTDITPSYIDDPYFKSAIAAQRYSDWKDRITPNPRRRKGTPNLYIIGTYHRSLDVSIQGEVISFPSSFRGAAAIRNKFRNIFGLGGRFKREFINTGLRPAIMEDIRANLFK